MDQDQIDRDETVEIKLLLEAICFKYGHDFRDYAADSLRRRIVRIKQKFAFPSISEMQVKVVADREFFATFLSDLTVTVSEMFRDPGFYKVLASEVLPVLATYPSVRIWHAGCSTGEEVYSLAILLKEEGLLDRATIYATDINPLALQKARDGLYTVGEMRSSAENYRKAGRRCVFADYFTAEYNAAVIDRSLKEKVVFASHNLATDGVFSEVHLILCRNVLIYFNKKMQNKVLRLFADSLVGRGFLCLGQKETLQFSECANDFAETRQGARIFQRQGDF